MTSSPPTPEVEAMARAHYEAVNMRVHGCVFPTWEQDGRKPLFCADMQAALTALCAARPDVAAVLEHDAAAVPLWADDDVRRAVWRAQYQHRREHGGPELQVSDEAIAALVEAKIACPAQRAQDEAAYAAQLACSPYARPVSSGGGTP